MQERARFYTEGHGGNDHAFNEIVKKAIEIEKEVGAEKIVFIGSSLQNDGWLQRQYGDNSIKHLRSGTKLPDSSLNGKFESLKSYHPHGNDLVITMGIDSEEILYLEDNDSICAILAVPWAKDGVDKWAKITNAIKIEDNTPTLSYPDPPCVVKVALQHLTEAVNMSTGLTHPSDGQLAKTYLRALSKYDYELNENAIEGYMFNHLGWEKETAMHFVEIVNKINSGKSFQGGDKTGLKRYIEMWQEECGN